MITQHKWDSANTNVTEGCLKLQQTTLNNLDVFSFLTRQQKKKIQTPNTKTKSMSRDTTTHPTPTPGL
eukprot:m.26455 g.26455  ORF g.26455 m.26455 type:complete len:68 (+) comp15405_c0_seq1:976-1179(+)